MFGPGKIGKNIERCSIVETFQSGPIVVVYEPLKEGVAVVVRDEEPLIIAPLRLSSDGLCNSSIEAFNEPIGLGSKGSCEPMLNAMTGAHFVEGMLSGRLVLGLSLHVDSEAIGELAAVVCENGVNRMREVGQEPGQECSSGLTISLGVDLQIDVAGGSIDGDECVALTFVQRREMLKIDVDKANCRLFKEAHRGLLRLWPVAKRVSFEASMCGASRYCWVDAASHYFGNIV